MFVALLMHMNAHDVPRVVEKCCPSDAEPAGGSETIDRPVTQAPYYVFTVLYATRCMSRLLRKTYGEIEVKFTEKWATYKMQAFPIDFKNRTSYVAVIDFQTPPVNSPLNDPPPMYGMRCAHVNPGFIYNIPHYCQWSFPGGYISLFWHDTKISFMHIFPRNSHASLHLRKTTGSGYAEFVGTFLGSRTLEVPSEMLRIAASFGFSLPPCTESKRRKRGTDE